MSEALSLVPDDHPMKIAWEAYKLTDDFANTKHWALRIMPMIQAGESPAVAKYQAENIMRHEMRERHVDGSLWAAFCEGWRAALADKGGRG